MPSLGAGEFAILAGVVSYAVYTVYLRRAGDDHSPVTLAAGSALVGLGLLVPWAGVELAVTGAPTLTTGTGLAIGYLGAVASAGTLLLWTYGVRGISATTAGAFTGVIPALGHLAALVAGEAPSWAKIVGGLVALTGVVIASSTTLPRLPRHDPWVRDAP